MKRGQSTDMRIRKQQAFKPIMLTSKSMRPVERGSPDKNKFQQKICSKNNDEDYKRTSGQNCMIYASHIAKTDFVKKMTEEYRQNLIKSVCMGNSSCGYNYEPKLRASIIKVEFEPENSPQKALGRYQQHNLFSDNRKNSKKYYYYTQTKNTEMHRQFKPSTANSHTTNISVGDRHDKKKESKAHEWENFLRKNSLTIKKARNLSNKPQLLVSQQKLEQISLKVSKYQANLLKKLEEGALTSKKESGGCEKEENSEKGQGNKNLKIFQKKSDLVKIEQDITSKRLINKKQHFVFGMGETSKNAQNSKLKFELYKDFLWKVAYSNGLHIHLRDQIEHPYRVYVGPGNNSLLIKGLLKRRYWWLIVDKVTKQTNFVWTQLKVNEYYTYQKKCQNILQNKDKVLLRTRKIHSSIDTSNRYPKIDKQSQPQNSDHLQLIDQNHSLEIFSNANQSTPKDQQEDENDPNSRIFCGTDYIHWQRHWSSNKKHEEKLENTLNKRIKTLIRKKPMKFIPDSSALKIHNHFERNYFLGNKKALFYSLRKYYLLINKNPFDYIPLTFHISEGLEDPEFQKFLEKYESLNEKKKKKEIQNIWIVKPGQHTNRGRGITVCSVLDQIKNRLRSKEKSRKNRPHTYIVQQYIEKPLLYQRRKFDIRHFMLMTCVNGKFKGYWYGQGYLRTTSFEYSTKNCKDLYTHLTNDAIQKYSNDYGKFEKGNKVSYQDFQKYLRNTYYRNPIGSSRKQLEDKYDFMNRILPSMKDIAADAIKATYLLLSPKRYEHNFELFGLDFMLDEDMNLYLIQVNTNPCLQTSCPLLTKIISGLIENIYKICVDPYFPPPFEWPNQRKMQMGENTLDENKFSIIFDECEWDQKMSKINQKIQKVDEKMGEIDEEEEEFEDEGKQWDED